MFRKMYPVFAEGAILKADMLACIAESSQEMMEQLFVDYSDGIISGVSVNTATINPNSKHGKGEGLWITVGKGLLKYKDDVYRLMEEIYVPYEADGMEKILKLIFHKKEERQDYMIYDTEVKLTADKEIRQNEMELCRFVLKEGAVLRKDYQNFKDFATVHNTMNIIHVPYAYPEQSTIAPKITEYFGKQLLRCEELQPIDYSFAFMCMQKKAISRVLLKSYIDNKLSLKNTKELSNEQIHSYLEQILEKVQNGLGSKHKTRILDKKIFVD